MAAPLKWLYSSQTALNHSQSGNGVLEMSNIFERLKPYHIGSQYSLQELFSLWCIFGWEGSMRGNGRRGGRKSRGLRTLSTRFFLCKLWIWSCWCSFYLALSSPSPSLNQNYPNTEVTMKRTQINCFAKTKRAQTQNLVLPEKKNHWETRTLGRTRNSSEAGNGEWKKNPIGTPRGSLSRNMDGSIRRW